MNYLILSENVGDSEYPRHNEYSIILPEHKDIGVLSDALKNEELFFGKPIASGHVDIVFEDGDVKFFVSRGEYNENFPCRFLIDEVILRKDNEFSFLRTKIVTRKNVGGSKTH